MTKIRSSERVAVTSSSLCLRSLTLDWPRTAEERGLKPVGRRSAERLRVGERPDSLQNPIVIIQFTAPFRHVETERTRSELSS